MRSVIFAKTFQPHELIKAIRVVNAGRKYIPSAIAEILSEHLGHEELTPAERKILQQIVKGKSNKEIAHDLNVSENTVKTHVKNILGKLGVSDRTSAATLAIRRGLVRIDSYKLTRIDEKNLTAIDDYNAIKSIYI